MKTSTVVTTLARSSAVQIPMFEWLDTARSLNRLRVAVERKRNILPCLAVFEPKPRRALGIAAAIPLALLFLATLLLTPHTANAQVTGSQLFQLDGNATTEAV